MIAAMAQIRHYWPAIAALVFAWVVFVAYRHGVSVEHARMQAAHAAELRQRQQEYEAKLEAVQAIARMNLAEQQRLDAAFDTLTEQVRAYEPTDGMRDCVPGADWVRIWNDANRGAAGGAGTLDGAMP